MSCRGRSKETSSRVTYQWPYVHMYIKMNMTFPRQHENATRQICMLRLSKTWQNHINSYIFMTSGHSHVTRNEVYIDVPQNVNTPLLIMIDDLNQIIFEFRSGQIKDYAIGMCCFSAKHAVLRSKIRKDWLACNQDNMSERRNMSSRNMFQWTSTVQIQLSRLVSVALT